MQDEVKKNKKKFFITGLIAGILSWFVIFLFLFFFESEIGSTYCIEDGDCEEGEVINTENGTITINEQTCLGNYGDWDEDKKMCFF